MLHKVLDHPPRGYHESSSTQETSPVINKAVAGDRRTRKRHRDGNPVPLNHDNDSEEVKSGKRQKVAEEPHDDAEQDPKRRFACPYYKHDPDANLHRSCRGPGWPTVHRVKYIIVSRC
jgi:hypothetical protein